MQFFSKQKIIPSPDDGEKKAHELKSLLSRAYGYSEINRLREKVIHDLREQKQKTLLVAAPKDDAGSTFLVSVLGYSAAYFSGMKVLLVDLNMRRPELHHAFGMEQEKGFTDVLIQSVPWAEVVKPSGLMELEVITAGKIDEDLSFFLNRPILSEIIPQMKEKYDFVVFDTSPVLVRNRNNLDPVYLSRECDAVLVVAQWKKTTKNDLRSTVAAIRHGGGEVKGIVFNRQHQQGVFGTLKGDHAAG